MNVIAGSWLIASVWSDFTKHSSSAIREVHGSSSLIQAPPWPYCANLKGEPAMGSVAWLADMPVSRCPMRTLAGRSWPCISLSFGLWSNRSIWAGPPLMNR